MKGPKKEHLKSFIYFITFSVVLSFFVSRRDLTVVEDNIIYVEHFYSLSSLSSIRYELLFETVTYLIRIFTDSYIIYFYIINFLLNIILFISIIKISFFLKYNLKTFTLISIFFILLSSWYYSAATNGLRQGLSLSLFYIASINIVFFRKYLYFIFFSLLSIFFHYSTLLAVPFLLFFKLSSKSIMYLNTLFAIGYITNINEYIVYMLSDFLNLNLYKSIKYYTSATGSDAFRYGFNLDLFIYTYGLGLIYFFFNCLILKNKNIYELIKIYHLLSLPYFLFGFAGFSNRYAFIAWLFTIFMNSVFFYEILNRNKSILFILFLLLMYASLLFFLNRFVI